MNNIFSNLFWNLKAKKRLFLLLVLISFVMIVLAVIASINFTDGVFTIDLNNISYIKFLKGECGFVSLFFGMCLSLLIFFLLIWVCGCKPFLFPLSILWFAYFVYSQAVIFVSIIMIYGFFNCVILSLILLIYLLLVIFAFMLILLEIKIQCECGNYFSNCLKLNVCNVLFLLIAMFVVTFAICLIISILKSFVLLLIY